MPRVVVGVDAGGTRTIAAVARGDEMPRTHVEGGANPNARGIDAALETIAQAITSALNGDVPDAIVVGGAGAARTDIAGIMTHALHARFPSARVVVTHDLRIALRAAIPSGDGFVLVAGTGAAVYGEIGAESYRYGGGGFALGDEGSGFAIGAGGLRLLRRSMEGRAPSDGLTQRLTEHTGAHDLDDLGRFAYGESPTVAAVASAAACVLECADRGERSAVKIVQSSALALFDLVRALCRGAGAESLMLPLVFSGGLLRRNSLLTYLVETRVANELPNLSIVKGGPEPYLGALTQARALLRDGAA